MSAGLGEFFNEPDKATDTGHIYGQGQNVGTTSAQET